MAGSSPAPAAPRRRAQRANLPTRHSRGGRRKQFFNPENRKELLWYTGSIALYWVDKDAVEL
jgi:hypothetical protein